ncbi:glycoside hydrolase family 3 protein [Erysipelotrichaceae bacterium RD49]|nr:glycoside hydrolase family 3 protein [Erysipelotrichaceae bacterium RD49]
MSRLNSDTQSLQPGSFAAHSTPIASLKDALQQVDEKEVEAILDSMSLEEKCAQMFIVELESLAISDQAANPEFTVTEYSQIANGQQNYPAGGIILFAKNLKDTEQTRNLLAQINQSSLNRIGLPAFLGVDEEGGEVARVANSQILGPIQTKSAQEIADTGSVDAALAQGKQIGAYLRELGFNLDFAPVADVLTNSSNPVMQGRTFGNDPNQAASLALAFANGLLDEDVLPVFKHFPGHGDTAQDSHAGYTYSNKTLDELQSCELIPFQSAIDQKMPLIMASHISLPDVTGSKLPASLSPDLVTGVLRDRMGFQGLVVTDSMQMSAISDYYSSSDAIGGAISAGVDLILMPADFQVDYQILIEKVKTGQIREERIDESVRRILRVKLALRQVQDKLQ